MTSVDITSGALHVRSSVEVWRFLEEFCLSHYKHAECCSYVAWEGGVSVERIVAAISLT